tara:strand:- start:217 stop:528 length:312 start_codon:yes stop_codon:yes gene_type:complete
MAKYKLTAAQKRDIKSQVGVARSTGNAPPRKKMSWSFKKGDLVSLNKKGMRQEGLDEPAWGVIADGAAGGGYFKVMTSGGLQSWHGGSMDRVQEIDPDNPEDV